MNALPFLGLAAIAATFGLASQRLEARFAEEPRAAVFAPAPSAGVPEMMAYDAGPAPSVYDMETLAEDDQPYDQPHCQMHAAMAENLRHDFAEAPVETRVAAEGLVMELWGSEVMGTWTILHKGNDGVSCIVRSGTGWVGVETADLAFADAGLAS